VKYIYLDNARTSYPKPEPMIGSMQTYLNEYTDVPVKESGTFYNQNESYVSDARRLLSDFLGVGNPFQISFTYNATYAINFLLKGFLKENDHLVISSYEHNAVLRPLADLQKKNISYDVWKCDSQGVFNISDLKKLIKKNTRLMFFSHTSNVLGRQIPMEEVAEVARNNDLLLGLDCTQSVGHMNLNLSDFDVDFVAGTGHKGLLGPTGVGFLYVKNAHNVASMIQGGGGYSSIAEIMPQIAPLKYEPGTMNHLGVVGLRSSMNWLFHNYENVILKQDSLKQYLMDSLLKIRGIEIFGGIGEDFPIPLISFCLKDLPSSQVASILESHYRIIVRAGLHCSPLIHEALGTMPNGAVRVSLSSFNSKKEVDDLSIALKEINQKRLNVV